MNYTNTTIAAALCAALAAPAIAEIELPEVSVGLDYSSKQVTRGLIDNEEGIVTASAAIEWQGFTAEVDGLFNITDEMKEDGYDSWDNTEVDYILGYGYTFGADDYGIFTDVEVAFDYTYEWDNGGDFEDNDHVQYLHASVGLPEIFLAPTPAGEIPWLLFTAGGSAGDELQIKLEGAPSMKAAYAYRSVFFADPALSEGQSCSLQAGSQTLEATAVR